MYTSWRTYLNKTSRMLKVVKKRNALQRQSEEKQRLYNTKRIKYHHFLKLMNEFAEGEDTLIKNSISLLASIMQDRLKYMLKQEAPALAKYEKAVQLSHEIERYKREMISLPYWNMLPKLSRKEIPKDRLYELIILILFACEKNPSLSEEDFVESKEDFLAMLQESKDPVLQQLPFNESILYTTLDLFLQEIPSSTDILVPFKD